VSIVTTSNLPSDDLYPNRLASLIASCPPSSLLKKARDHQRRHGTDYRPPHDGAGEAFSHTARTLKPMRDDAGFRSALPMPRKKAGCCTSSTASCGRAAAPAASCGSTSRELCGGPRSQNDYLELATQFHTVLVSNVPQMTPRHASEARRFTWLVDVMYDRRVKLIMSAEVPPEMLYAEGPLAHEFPRTVSRLAEMQSAEFLALARRDVDTSLT
jgi:cell division protein ZapE